MKERLLGKTYTIISFYMKSFRISGGICYFIQIFRKYLQHDCGILIQAKPSPTIPITFSAQPTLQLIFSSSTHKMSSDSSNNGSSSSNALNIPTMEEVENRRANRSKQMPNFFKSSSSTTKTPSQVNAATTSIPSNPTLPANTTTLANNSTVQQPIAQPAATRPFNSSASPRTSTTPPSRTSTASPSTIKRSTGGNAIFVHPKQHKNPILEHIRNVPWEPSEQIKVDYVVGQTTGVLYLSLRYHRLYPNYIYDRLADTKNLYVTRILLVYVDVDSYHDALLEINRIAILSDFTLMLAWSMEEVGRYLETYKALEHKGPDLIRGRVEEQYLERMTDCLTQVRSVNKTDVLTLLSTFGSLKNVSDAKADALAMCPGFGDQKVKRLQLAFKQPFLANKKQKS